ncbi:MAG TPA: DUF4259 domain-containing protein [Humisphaera sp.]
MGTWAHEPLANDTALDWAIDLKAVDDLSLVEDTLADALAEEDGVVDATLGEEVLAACEVIARLRGRWGRRDAYSRDIDAWVEKHPQPVPAGLLKRAAKAIDVVLGDDSELRELWYEGTGGDDWAAAVGDLRRRVVG